MTLLDFEASDDSDFAAEEAFEVLLIEEDGFEALLTEEKAFEALLTKEETLVGTRAFGLSTVEP